MVKTYLFTGLQSLGQEFIDKCICFFPEWRREQMLSFKFLQGKIENAVAYLLLVKALKDLGMLAGMPQFEYNAHGKPFLKDYPGLFFSLSHCKRGVVCVVSDSNVGVDIECVERNADEKLIRYVCNAQECNAIFSSADPALSFMEYWTKKEAVVKYLGTGIDTGTIKEILSDNSVRCTTHIVDGCVVSTCLPL